MAVRRSGGTDSPLVTSLSEHPAVSRAVETAGFWATFSAGRTELFAIGNTRHQAGLIFLPCDSVMRVFRSRQ